MPSKSVSRDRDKYRKYDSGAEKSRKRKRREEFEKKQAGSFEKFLVVGLDHPSLSRRQQEDEETTETGANSVTCCQGDTNLSAYDADTKEADVARDSEHDVNKEDDSECSADYSQVFQSDELSLATITDPENEMDVFDPGNWDNSVILSEKIIDMLVERGPVRVSNEWLFPVDDEKRHFSPAMYSRKLPNGQSVDRRWLVYSKVKDAAFCFCCKLYGRGNNRNTKLTEEGNRDWKHLSTSLKSHEISMEHIKNLKIWLQVQQRLATKNTLCQKLLEGIEKEKLHWRSVLQRIIAGIEYLAIHNMAFRGTAEKLGDPTSGPFLGLMEMLAKFDPTMKEHVRRIKTGEILDHYLGHQIQDELIVLMASQVRKTIIEKIKQAKYFSVILDCTPDVSHKEQMSLVIRFVDASDQNVEVREHFIEFLRAEDTTGKGLTDTFLEALPKHGLDIGNCRGQGYDNGANMKGKHQGVQARILEINPRAFYTPCGCHNLNLVLGDMAKCNAQAKTFFGVLQRIYCIFSGCTGRWKVLQEHVPYLTAKPLSETRWECRIESVKAVRYQTTEIRNALLTVAGTANDPKVSSEAASLANYELGNFEFLLAMIIWYDVLFAVNTVSKTLQSSTMQLDVAITHVQGLISFFTKYREEGFASAMTTAKEIASEMQIEPVFKERRNRRRKRQFEYESRDETTQTPEETFRVEYFLWIIDQALGSLETRFEQLRVYADIFGFLYDIKQLRTMALYNLRRHCTDLDMALRSGDSRDVDASDLFEELKVLREMIPGEVQTALQCLQFLVPLADSFPNAAIAYKIMLTVPVTVASAERSFSKLKLIKTYLRSSISQVRLNGLAMLSIERDIVSTLDYEELIEVFATKKARKVNFR